MGTQARHLRQRSECNRLVEMGLDVIEGGFDTLLGRGQGIRMAAKAGDVALPLGLRSGQKDQYISTLRIACGTRRTTVDSGCDRCIYEFVIIMPVFVQHGFPRDVAYLTWFSR